MLICFSKVVVTTDKKNKAWKLLFSLQNVSSSRSDFLLVVEKNPCLPLNFVLRYLSLLQYLPSHIKTKPVIKRSSG